MVFGTPIKLPRVACPSAQVRERLYACACVRMWVCMLCAKAHRTCVRVGMPCAHACVRALCAHVPSQEARLHTISVFACRCVRKHMRTCVQVVEKWLTVYIEALTALHCKYAGTSPKFTGAACKPLRLIDECVSAMP